MATFIRINAGTYRNNDVSGQVFELNTEFQPYAAGGGFVVVNNAGMYSGYPKIFRIKVSGMSDYQIVNERDAVQTMGDVKLKDTKVVAPVVVEETDEEIMTRIATRFEILDDMTKAAVSGDIRAMIVSGPPGVGKSYGVERELEKASLFDKISGKRVKSEVIKGSTTALGLYTQLYKFSDEGCVLVFDDCDSILLDDVALNLLKGALDSGKRRRISWLSDSHMLRSEGIPSTFDFKGTVIFITNLKFDQMKSQKLRDHLDALQSRCHYLDLTLNTMRDKLLRIKQVARTGELFSDYDIGEVGQAEIIDFMDTNQNRLREMSLRMAVKVSELYKSFPMKWKAMAESTCMRNA